MNGRRLPFFVYGTLRPGGRHHGWALAGRTAAQQPARLPGVVLYEGPGFPYAVPAPEDPRAQAHGELIHPAPGHYETVLKDLDHLEGYLPGAPGNHYERMAMPALTPDGGRIDAWVYVAAGPLAARLRRDGRRVPGDDWTAA
ncbi:gamma-glutamylcyclotransferase [Streptomyces sodiiphilus]|uniref:Gamma-glutamylcyclotransferase n=1 Tax=Streptomyces sodiiphilus TaxID=226217 RepID=A0ABN2P6V6_9ACTN